MSEIIARQTIAQLAQTAVASGLRPVNPYPENSAAAAEWEALVERYEVAQLADVESSA